MIEAFGESGLALYEYNGYIEMAVPLHWATTDTNVMIGYAPTTLDRLKTSRAAAIGGEQIKSSARHSGQVREWSIQRKSMGRTDGRTALQHDFHVSCERRERLQGDLVADRGAGTHSAHYSTGSRTTTSPQSLQSIKRRGD